MQCTSLKNNNRICVSVAGYEMCAIVDSGSTLSTISHLMYEKIKTRSNIKQFNCIRQCMLADGSKLNLNIIITVPLRIAKVTFRVNLYVLENEHINMIIGCDILQKLQAVIDYNKHQFIVYRTVEDSKTIASLGVLSYIDSDKVFPTVRDVKLNPRVEKIHLADTETTEEQKQRLIRLMNKYELCFANNLNELGRTNIMEYDIETVPGIEPIRLNPYKCAYKHREIIYEEIANLRNADLIRPARRSRWGFPTVLVNKPHSNKMRMCSDVRILNDKTILQPYPMLNINFLLADIGRRKCKYFSVIDLSDSYRQIPLSKRSQEIATMSTIVGDFSPTTCIFGLKNLPFVFTKLMDQIFYSIRGIYMDFYIDDLVLFDPTFDLHIQHIEEVLKRLRNANLTAKPVKTFLCKKTVQFLGFTISKQGIATTDENIEKIKKFPIPVKQKDVRAFLGISNFYKRHIFQYGQIAQPLYELTKKLEGPFKWTKEANSAFEILKNKLTTAPILAFPDIDSKEPLIVTVDTSSIGIGYVLSQRQRSDHTWKLIERPICYGSTNLKGTQTKMGSTDLETWSTIYFNYRS